jgi:hypothetical protein
MVSASQLLVFNFALNFILFTMGSAGFVPLGDGPDGSTPRQYVDQFRGDGKVVGALQNQTETGTGTGGGLTDAVLAAPLLGPLVELLFAPLIVISNLTFIPIQFRLFIGGILAIQAIVAVVAAFRGGGIR